MIDENRLIEELKFQINNCETYGHSDIYIDLEMAKKWVETIEKKKVGEWIPVEERLPEQSLNSVIGWDAYRERCCFVQYYMNEWILGNHESVKIVAWMPLPEPFKGETLSN